MRFMLDTDTCIYLLNRSHPALTERILAHRASDFTVSAVTAAELTYGATKSRSRKRSLERLRVFRREIATSPFDDAAIEAYGAVRVDLERRGIPIGPLDTLIAAHAVSLDLLLITNNVKEFRRVKGLRCESWI